MNKIYVLLSCCLLSLSATSCMEVEYESEPVDFFPGIVSLSATAENVTTNSVTLIGTVEGDYSVDATVGYGFYITTDSEYTPESYNVGSNYHNGVYGGSGSYGCGDSGVLDLGGLEAETTYYYYYYVAFQDFQYSSGGYRAKFSERYSFTTTGSVNEDITGLWVEDNTFSSMGNVSFEFKPYGTVVQRQFGMNTDATFIGSGEYSLSAETGQITATIGGRQTSYTVSDYSENSMTLTDFRDNSYTLTKVDNSISVDYANPVDLGLPSGTLWSDCNLGAFSPDDLGGRYAWGETTEKEEYTSGSYLYYGVNIGTYINSTQYDAAYQMSDKWEMPTKEQFEEFIENCKFSYENGLVKATGPNGNSIYLPEKKYWAATNYSNTSSKAYLMNMADVELEYDYYDDTYKYGGYYIRPVYKK